MNRAIITYAAGAHEELLDVALPTYRDFAQRHGYDMLVTRGNLVESLSIVPNANALPPAWRKIPLLLDALNRYETVVWFDCDLVVVNPTDDLPVMPSGCSHALVRHFEDDSEVPNSGVWQLRRSAVPLLEKILELEVFTNHGWYEQAALMTLMGYTVPTEGSEFHKTKCKPVYVTKWLRECHFMRLAWNSHPNYKAEKPRIVHCSYKSMQTRIEVMRALVKDPVFDYPRYGKVEEPEKCEDGKT